MRSKSGIHRDILSFQSMTQFNAQSTLFDSSSIYFYPNAFKTQNPLKIHDPQAMCSLQLGTITSCE